jgi:hypothetical protein
MIQVVCKQINNYFMHGGPFNYSSMTHDVSDLIILINLCYSDF